MIQKRIKQKKFHFLANQLGGAVVVKPPLSDLKTLTQLPGQQSQQLHNFTCHSCKHKCADIWRLLEHVFQAHGFRISDESLPNFDYATNATTSNTTSVTPFSSGVIQNTTTTQKHQQRLKNTIFLSAGRRNLSCSTPSKKELEEEEVEQAEEEEELLSTTSPANNVNQLLTQQQELLQQQQQPAPQMPSLQYGSLLNSILTPPQSAAGIHDYNTTTAMNQHSTTSTPSDNSNSVVAVNNMILNRLATARNRFNCT